MITTRRIKFQVVVKNQNFFIFALSDILNTILTLGFNKMARNSFRDRMTSYINELIDPISYYDWVNQNTTIGGVPFTCDRYPFQKAILNDMSLELHCIKPSQIGLALDLNTKIPTPTGWTTMGDVQVGDLIYAPDGTETKVTFKSEVYTDHKCYAVKFSDGTEIIADENHKWKVSNPKAFSNKGFCTTSGRLPKDSEYATTNVVNTAALAKMVGTNKNSFYISVTEPLKCEAKDLEIDPYLLGLWLGDGHSYSAYISCQESDIEELTNQLANRGYSFERYDSKGRVSSIKPIPSDGTTFYSKLLKLNLLKNKHIPQKYLRASIEQRLELLRGLIDTDGTINRNGRISFSNVDQALIEQTKELIVSLGFKISERQRQPKKSQLKNGHWIHSNSIFEISFLAYADVRVANYARKYVNQKVTGRVSETKRRYIISVTEVEPVPVQCLTVDHSDHLFLCSESMITTHNTEVQLRKALAFTARNPHRNLIYTMPDENMRKRVYQNRVLPILTEDAIFHGLNAAGKKPIRSIEMTEINSSFMMMFPANEKAATSQPADVIFNDEVDLSDPQILALFNSRVQGSDLRMIHNYSTPTYDGLGISALFENSDQHEYLFKCPHCGHYQLPEFTSKFIRIPNLPAEAAEDLTQFDPIWIDKYGINPFDAYSVCIKCGKRVTYGDDQNHKWVARHPHRSHSRGYRVSPFSTRNLDAAYVLRQYLDYHLRDNMKGFHNTVLGKTHESSDERLSEALLRTLFTAHSDYYYEHQDKPHFIGIDMGKVCHITIGAGESLSKIQTVLFEAVKVEVLLERVKYYMNAFPIQGGFIDRLPLITDSNRIRDFSDFSIMPMQYGRQSGGAIVVPKTDEYGQLDYVEAHRTLHLDKLANAIRSGFITFCGYTTQKETIIAHLRAMVRQFEEDKDGVEKVPVWKKKDRNDHYFHSMGYMYQAAVQFFDGYSYLDTEEYNSSIMLGSIEEFSFSSQQNKLSIIGGR